MKGLWSHFRAYVIFNLRIGSSHHKRIGQQFISIVMRIVKFFCLCNQIYFGLSVFFIRNMSCKYGI